MSSTDDVEQKLAEIWCQVLNINSLSINDNFFDLGGHSQLLRTVKSLINKRISKKVSLTDMYENSEFGLLASHIRCLTEEREEVCGYFE